MVMFSMAFKDPRLSLISSTARSDREVSDDELLSSLYKSDYRHLVRIATFLIGDSSSAEEVVADSFVKSYRRLKASDSPSAYVKRAVINGCRSHYRRRTVKSLPLAGVDVVDQSASLDTAMIQQDAAHLIRYAMAGLSDRQRECVTLRYFDGLGEQMIGDLLGLSRNSVKTHLQRALAILESRLDELK